MAGATADPSPRPTKRARHSAADTSFEANVDFLRFDFSDPEPEPSKGKATVETRLPAVRDGKGTRKKPPPGSSKRKAIDLDLEDGAEARAGSHPWAHYVRWQDYRDSTDQCVPALTSASSTNGTAQNQR
jgi:hypothetical protein